MDNSGEEKPRSRVKVILATGLLLVLVAVGAVWQVRPGLLVLRRPRTHLGGHPQLALNDYADVRDLRALAKNSYLLMQSDSDRLFVRIPAHLDTTFKWFPTYDVFGKYETSLLGVNVIDILSYYPQELLLDPALEPWRLRRQANLEQWGWQSKNLHGAHADSQHSSDSLSNLYVVPALAYAWSKDSSKEWYVFIKDDRIFTPSALVGATDEHNPDDVIYIGRTHGEDGNAGGDEGAAVVLSRGAMRALFGATSESILEEVRASFETAKSSQSLDAVVERRLHAKAQGEFNFNPSSFQCSTVAAAIARFDGWCAPLGTFRFENVWDLKRVGEWYNSLVHYAGRQYTPLYYDFYRDFIMPHAIAEINGWDAYADSLENFSNSRVFGRAEKPSHSAAECRDACDGNGDCYMWHFKQRRGCEHILYGVVSGMASNKYQRDFDDAESIVGYMVERIVQARGAVTCDPGMPTEGPVRNEGWLMRSFLEHPPALALNTLGDSKRDGGKPHER